MNKLFIVFVFLAFNLFSQQKENKNINNFLDKYNVILNKDLKINFLDSVIKNTTNFELKCSANLLLARVYYKETDSVVLAKEKLHVALLISKKLEIDYKVDILLNYAYLFQKKSKTDSALYYFNKALNNTPNTDNYLLSKVNANIARLLFKEKRYVESINFYQKSIFLGKKSKRDLCTTYNNFGSLYLELKKSDSAIYYYKKSLVLATKSKNKKKELRSHVNLALAYLETPKMYKKGYNSLLKSEQIAVAQKYYRYLYYIHFHLGEYFEKINNRKQAIKYYNLALNSQEAKVDYQKQIEILEILAKFYEKESNFFQANQYIKQYHKLKDSIYSVEKTKAFNEIKTKYEVAEKDTKITLLTKEKQLEKSRKNNILISALSILALLLLLTYFLRNKIKSQRIAQEQKQRLFKQELKTKNALNLIKGQEDERERLAKELHDGLGGQLSGVKSIVQTISIHNLQEKTAIVDKHLSNSIKNLRNISHDLSANFLKNKDFDLLLHQLIKQVFENINVTTEISLFPKEKINSLPERYKLNIYRILQESLQNIIKHADADFVSFNLIIDSEITLLIEDNGKGFRTSGKVKGIGLQNIKDRLQSLNGTLHIDSKLNKGTVLNINIPND